MEEDPGRESFDRDQNVKALDRGLRVITAISDAGRPLSVSEIASAVGITRPAARRFVLTLEHLGYLALERGSYVLQPPIVEVGESYLSGQVLPLTARPHLERLARQVIETVSLTVLHEDVVTYVDRVRADRIFAINIVVGSRVPAYATATGTILLAGLTESEFEAYLDRVGSLPAMSNDPSIDVDALRERVARAQQQGWILADQQLRIGVCSLAVPVVDAAGSTISALNISAATGRISNDDMVAEYLGPLRETSRALSIDYAEATRAKKRPRRPTS